LVLASYSSYYLSCLLDYAVFIEKSNFIAQDIVS